MTNGIKPNPLRTLRLCVIVSGSMGICMCYCADYKNTSSNDAKALERMHRLEYNDERGR
jgi:hypothetical protein